MRKRGAAQAGFIAGWEGLEVSETDIHLDEVSPLPRVAIGRIHTNPATFSEALKYIAALTARSGPHLVVTPNIAHVWQSEHSNVLRSAYERASFAPPDGWPVVSAVKFLEGRRAPVERVAGSDLMIELCRQEASVFLIGGADDSAALAADELVRNNPDLKVCGVELAPRDELDDPTRRADLVGRCVASGADYFFVGLGVPQQEKLALELVDRLDRGVVMCIGASIEFAAGTRRRAPRWVQRYGQEWLYRLLQEPARLAPRYARSAPYFLGAVVREKYKRLSLKWKRSGSSAPERPETVDRLVVHQFDPARPSPGGIDTCLRGLCRYAPADQELAIVGVDTGGGPPGRRLGVWERHKFDHRSVWFLPVARLDPADQRRRIPHSVRLAAGLVLHRHKLPRSAYIQAHRMDTAMALRALIRRQPLVYFIHTQESGLTGSNSDSFWRLAASVHSRLERTITRVARDVVVFNEDYANIVKAINPNSAFSPTWYDPQLIIENSVARDPYTIVWVGRLETPKDPMLALESFAKLVQTDFDIPWKLDVLGVGTLLADAEAALETYPLEVRSRVVLRGRVEPAAVARIMSTSGIFLMTSQPGYEGYPRVLVEALASGLSAVVTGGSDTGSLVTNGVNGYVTSRSSEEIALRMRDAVGLSRRASVSAVSALAAPSVVASLFNRTALVSGGENIG